MRHKDSSKKTGVYDLSLGMLQPILILEYEITKFSPDPRYDKESCGAPEVVKLLLMPYLAVVE